MEQMCIATTKEGRPCSAGPVRPSGYCYWHDPALLEQRLTDRQRGGAARSNVARARKQLQRDVMTLSDVQGVLCRTLARVVAGETEPGVGTAAATLGRAIAAIATVADLEQRLTALEAVADINGRKHG